MAMSKQQIIGLAGGGAFVLCAGALGFMLFSAWAEKGEKEEQLEGETSSYTRYNSAAVYPSRKSIDSVKSNQVAYAEWYERAMAVAAKGDRKIAGMSPALFKQRLQAEVRRMLELPGVCSGKIAAPAFLFGFEQFLGEGGVLPEAADVPRLASQLQTVAKVVDVLAESGLVELRQIQRPADPSKKSARGDDEDGQSKKSAKGNKGAKAADEPKETVEEYGFELLARPAALVSALNQFTACELFVTVKNLAFKQSADVIVDRLNAAEAPDQGRGSGRSARLQRLRGGDDSKAKDAKAEEGSKPLSDRLVSDPEQDQPLLVTFTLEVRDFGRAASAPEAAKPAEVEEKPAEKKAEAKGEGK